MDRLPERDSLTDLVRPDHAHEGQIGEHTGKQVGERQVAIAGHVAKQADEVAEVAPHQLRPEDAVGRRARLHRPLEIAVVRGPAPERRARRGSLADATLAEVVEDRLVVVDAHEVLLRAPRPAALAQRLEVLLRSPGDPGRLSAWHTSVLPLRGVVQTR